MSEWNVRVESESDGGSPYTFTIPEALDAADALREAEKITVRAGWGSRAGAGVRSVELHDLDMLVDGQRRVMVLGIDQGRPVASAQIAFDADDDYSVIQILYVEPSFRRAGIGSAIVERAVEIVAGTGCEPLHAYCHPDYDGINLFRALEGWLEVDQRGVSGDGLRDADRYVWFVSLREPRE